MSNTVTFVSIHAVDPWIRGFSCGERLSSCVARDLDSVGSVEDASPCPPSQCFQVHSCASPLRSLPRQLPPHHHHIAHIRTYTHTLRHHHQHRCITPSIHVYTLPRRHTDTTSAALRHFSAPRLTSFLPSQFCVA
jgi:hypothetical protein